MSESKEIVNLAPGEQKQLIDKILGSDLSDSDKKTITRIIGFVVYLHQELTLKKFSIKRLKRLFGMKTEKQDKMFKDQNSSPVNKSPPPKPGGDDKPGHGKRSREEFSVSETKFHPVTDVELGQCCPDCGRGSLYSLEPGHQLCIYGEPPLNMVDHELERLRCSGCQKIFKAKPPEKKRATISANALVSVLRYASGFPLNRLSDLQAGFGVPLSPSSLWSMCEEAAKPAYAIFKSLIRFAANGELFNNDDTSMRINDLKKELLATNDTRQGIYTSGIVAKCENREIVLFFTGNKHAGENLTKVLAERSPFFDPPLQMCDALSRNIPEDLQTIVCNCLTHARRLFVDVAEVFSEECRYVLSMLALVYKNEALCKKLNLSPKDRLLLHQRTSKHVLKRLRKWCLRQLKQRKVEPNSPLGEAIRYLLKHWQRLTQFLRLVGAPLTNDIVEHALKKAILHRKNSYFYKTLNGALVGDIMMSITQTCIKAKVNPYKYLIALQQNVKAVFAAPEKWLPWNYLEVAANSA